MACVPTEPVEPTSETVFTATGSGAGEVQELDEVVRRGQHEEQGVEAVEHPTVAGEDAARVLEAEVALHHRLAQVAERADDRRYDGEEDGAAEAPRVDPTDE